MSMQLCYNMGRLTRMALRGQNLSAAKHLNIVQSSRIFGLQPAQSISTSKKKRETIAPAITNAPVETKSEEKVEKKYWVSQGFDYESEYNDILYRNTVFFWTITVGLVITGYIWLYIPDVRFKNWAQREAYIELARREALGLPQIDPNLIPVENFDLPSEEELGDFNIIV